MSFIGVRQSMRKMRPGTLGGQSRSVSPVAPQRKVDTRRQIVHSLTVTGDFITSADLVVPMPAGDVGDRIKTVFVSSRTFTSTTPPLTTDETRTVMDSGGIGFTMTVAHAIRSSSDSSVTWAGMSTVFPAYHIGIVADSPAVGSPRVLEVPTTTDPSIVRPSPLYGVPGSFQFIPPVRALVVLWSGGGILWGGGGTILVFPSIGGANERLIAWDSADPIDVEPSGPYDGPRYLVWWPI